ncbi:MAG TPA: AAA family ATPase, partial [Candidatus Binatia bacterium]|nr:AAA family ATPase [Candidatus Binatia bacterium]
LQIGIAEGPSYAGAYGGTSQRTFGVLGKDVNLAARLMSQAPAGRVLVSPSVTRAVGTWFELHEQPTMVLKGLDDAVTPHLVIAERATGRNARDTAGSHRPTIGRAAELASLERGLDHLIHGEGGCFVIEGEAGIGKTHLIEHLTQSARERGALAFAGGGDPLRSAMPYAAWRPVFEKLLGVSATGGEPAHALEPRIAHTRAAVVAIDPASETSLPLLGTVLGIAIPDTPETARLDARSRADNTNDLLIRLLLRSTDTRPLIVVMEDAHWLDSSSASLLARIVREATQALVLVTTRPIIDAKDEALTALLSTPRVEHLALSHLDHDETAKLVCRHLGVTSIPPSVSRLIAERAEGSPFFSQQLAESLVHSGHIAIENGTCTEASTGIDPSRMSFPSTIQGLITSRIDTLPSRQQLAVKVASVIGRYFSYRALHDVHPVSADKTTLSDDLAALVTAGVTVVHGHEPELAYAFGHALTHEVAYGSLLYRQRCELHRALGRWYEQEHGNDLGAQAAVLAHHWSHAARGAPADVTSFRKAIDYLELAGVQALRSYSNREAARFLGDAVSLDAERSTATRGDDVIALAVTKEQLRRARWHSGLGHAHLALSDFARCRTDFYAALELLGHAVPRTPMRLGAGMLAELAKQAASHLGRQAGGREPPTPAEATILTERTDALRILSKAFFHENNSSQVLYAKLCDLHYAERLGPSPALALIYSHMLLTLGVFQMHRWARSYGRRSLEIARGLDDPGTLVTVLVNHGVYHTGNGDWSSAREVLEEGRSIAERLGDHTQWGECTAVLADAAQLEGDLARSGALYGELAASAERRGNAVQVGWSLRPRVLEALRSGDAERAIDILTHAMPALHAAPDALIKIDANGLLALAQARAGYPAAARASIERTNALVEPRNPPVTYPRHLGLGAVAEAALLLLERASESGAPREERRELSRIAARACRNLHRYRRVFRVGAPAAWRYQGWLYALSNRPRRARATLEKSVSAAVRLKMPEAEALARSLSARYR